MPFFWTAPPALPAKSQSAAHRAAVDTEILVRAALMARLGVAQRDATRRLRVRSAWEHDCCQASSISDKRIQTLVRKAYTRLGL